MQLGLTPSAEVLTHVRSRAGGAGGDRLRRDPRASGPTDCPTWPSRPAAAPQGPRPWPTPRATRSASELGPEYADLELRDLDPRTIVRKHIIEAMEDEDASRAGAPSPSLAEGQVPPYDVDAT